jgi:beta-lactamase regulating signal transducer with metallopeptidase domain/DUF4097 and DUF4098 domain-containing protein YvlB
MISIFIEAAVRSLVVGLVVAAGLWACRVRNVLAKKAAWGLVLVSALVMPLLLPVTAQWHLAPAGINVVLPAHPMTLLEELQARILAKKGSGVKLALPTVPSDPPQVQEPPAPQESAAPRSFEAPPHTINTHHAAKPDRDTSIASDRAPSSSAQPIANNANPTPALQSTAAIRHIPFPARTSIFILYSAIAAFLLIRLALGLFTTIRLWRTATPVPPCEMLTAAASLPLRASNKVASPITVGSAILLPADYQTWDSEKLRIVLAHERSHIRQGDFYLQLLAGIYAALVWFSPLGWWLKHALAELAEAISDRAGIREAASATSYAQILLEFAAMPRRISIGVAMARPGSLSRRIERLLNDNSFRQCFAGGRRTLIAVTLVPLAIFASTALVRVQAAASTTPAFLVAPQLNTGQVGFVATAVQPGRQELPQLPSAEAVLAKSSVPGASPGSEMIAAVSPSPASDMAPAVAAAGAGVEQAGSLSFDRTLSVSGTAQLTVSTGSGNIKISRGSGNQIQIHGRIHVNHEGSEEQARQIAANPPIEQNGDEIRVGRHQEQWHGISVDYEIEAPAGTVLTAQSGSGDIVAEGVGQNAKLETGSGDISATSLEGPFTVKSGSGNITAAQTGQGDVVAETGSGDIELKDIHGGFHGQTGSGDIKASGTPSASWILQTGSGDVELWTGNAPLTLDASTGTGSVVTDHEMMVQGTFDHHHVRGNLNGGGPTVRVQTGSGDVHIH